MITTNADYLARNKRSASTAAESDKAPTVPALPASSLAFKRHSTDGELYLLPGCGLVALLRRPGLIGLVAAGATGNPALSPELVRMMALDDKPTTEEAKIADFERNAKAYQEVAARCFVSPRLVTDRAPDYDNGEIGPADITDRDYVWIYWTFTQGAAAQVAPFRQS